MTTERIKEIQSQTAHPNSVSVQQALLQVWNEVAQKYETFNKKEMKAEAQWWGYLHKNGTIQAKRGFSDSIGDIREAKSSPFVVKTYGPFVAKDREDALNILQRNL